MDELEARVVAVLTRLRATGPLVHHITNSVVTNDTANLTLHLGAAPVMAAAVEEAGEMAGHADALVLNIGTLTPPRLEAMLAAGRRAAERGIPIVLDPVGVGATSFRDEAVATLLDALPVTVVRGNPGEIATLAGADGQVRGVDSVSGGSDLTGAARRLASDRALVVAVTGPVDIVTDGQRVLRVANGTPRLAEITGSGCMATTAIACCTAVESDAVLAAATGLALMGLAGERAARMSAGPGSFKVALMDAAAALHDGTLVRHLRVSGSADATDHNGSASTAHVSPDLRLYVLLDPEQTAHRALDELARQAIDGGATMLQVRAKRASTRELLRLTRAVLDVARPHGVPVIVNDRSDIALAAGADGVHVGEDDLPVAAARRLLGPDAIIGYSAGTPAAADDGARQGADYLGTGDVFGTRTKPDADAPIGLDGLRAVVERTSLPVVAIGGVDADNAADAVAAGADGVAVISAVIGADDVTAAARRLRSAVDGARDDAAAAES